MRVKQWEATLGGKGGQTGPVAGNDQIVAMQQQQAAQATQANQERTARLSYGTQNIKNIFEGTPTGSTPLDFSSITQADAPAPRQTAEAAAASNPVLAQWQAQNPSAVTAYDQQLQQPQTKQTLANGYSWGALPDDGSGTPQYGLFDPSGNLVNSGSTSDLASTKVYAGGTPGTSTSPFGDDFYNKYRQSVIDYLAPQEDQQYSDARTSLAASLARAGQLDSSTATMDIGKLSKQDQLNTANIASNADTQTGALRSTVSQDEQTALNQLYSTEDPSVAANTAQNLVANASLTKPLLNPAGALFAPLTVGVGNALSGFVNNANYINPSATGAATTSSGASGSGQTVQT